MLPRTVLCYFLPAPSRVAQPPAQDAWWRGCHFPQERCASFLLRRVADNDWLYWGLIGIRRTSGLARNDENVKPPIVPTGTWSSYPLRARGPRADSHLTYDYQFVGDRGRVEFYCGACVAMMFLPIGVANGLKSNVKLNLDFPLAHPHHEAI